MKLSGKSTLVLVGAGIVAVGLHLLWDRTRFREASYDCSDGPRQLELGVPMGSPTSAEFYLTGAVSEGEVEIIGFPTGKEEDLKFSASKENISLAYTGDWYDTRVPVRFEPSGAKAACYFRIVYRVRTMP